MKEIKSVVILGSGNVGSYLAKTLIKSGVEIKQIFSRNQENAKELASKIGKPFTTDINELLTGADLYIFAVSDSAIAELLSKHDWKGMFLVHTAGSVNLDIFKGFTENYGILYPLQTFTKGLDIEFENIPVCVEANNPENTGLLKYLALKISESVICIDSQQRAALHLAAVFANNFSNHMYSIAFDLLKKNNLPTNLLTPLIIETARKALEITPKKAQTGPAIRGNTEVMNRHIEMLSSMTDWQKIYTFASKSIADKAD